MTLGNHVLSLRRTSGRYMCMWSFVIRQRERRSHAVEPKDRFLQFRIDRMRRSKHSILCFTRIHISNDQKGRSSLIGTETEPEVCWTFLTNSIIYETSPNSLVFSHNMASGDLEIRGDGEKGEDGRDGYGYNGNAQQFGVNGKFSYYSF